MKLKLIRVSLLLAVGMFLGGPAFACLWGGGDEAIQAALDTTGIAELCPGALFYVLNPIRVPANGKIFTSGYPTDHSQKAVIMVFPYAAFYEPVINGHTQPNVEIRNIIISGNRDAIGYYVYSRALLAVNGNNSVIDHIHAVDAGANQNIASADNPNCDGLRITNNFVGFSGRHYRTQEPGAWPGPWTDGIGLRCSNAYVAYNEVRDLTDGAITFYGGQNTIIEHNWIANSGRSIFSGIVASGLFNGGDFTGSVVRNNLIQTCCGQHIHVALAIGDYLWCDLYGPSGGCNISTGVSFVNNSGNGSFGWGIVVDGMLNATVQNNNLYMHEARVTPCFIPGQNYYVVNTQRSSGSFQPDYVVRTNLHVPCLGGH